MRKRWTNRKLFTVRFKGREPRALLWRKPVYKEWFLYAKLAQELGKKIPKAFGNLKKFDDFEDWWRHPKYGFELFCEKPMGELVQETQPNRSKLQPDELLLKINLKGDNVEQQMKDFINPSPGQSDAEMKGGSTGDDGVFVPGDDYVQ